MTYVSTAEVKRYLGIDFDDVDDNALLADLTQRAQSAIESHTGRVFAAAVDTVRMFDQRAVDGWILYLDADLCAITSVVNGDGVTVAANQYRTAPRNVAPWYALILVPTATALWDGLTGEIAVTGRWAYSITPPPDVVQATVRLTAWLYRQKDNTGNDQPIIAGNATILPSRLPADVLELLQPYVKVLL